MNRESQKTTIAEMKNEGPRVLAYRVTDNAGEIWTVIYRLEGGRIRQVLTQKKDAPGVGDIYLGRVAQVAAGIGSSFADTEGGRFFLPGRYRIGEMLPVRVETLAFREKLAKATPVLAVNGKYMVLGMERGGVSFSRKLTAEQKAELQRMLERAEVRTILADDDWRILFRTAAGKAEPDDVCRELQTLVQTLRQVTERASREARCVRLYEADSVIAASVKKAGEEEGTWVATSEELYREAVEEAKKAGIDRGVIRRYEDKSITASALYGLQGKLKQILSERVWLDSGAEIVITEAEAMCVIDVNSAKISGSGREREENFLRLNLEAAREIVAQIGARNISGTILIDFISMKRAESETILLSEMNTLARDIYPPLQVVDITKLGIMETTRQRLSGSIREKSELLNKTILI